MQVSPRGTIEWRGPFVPRIREKGRIREKDVSTARWREGAIQEKNTLAAGTANSGDALRKSLTTRTRVGLKGRIGQLLGSVGRNPPSAYRWPGGMWQTVPGNSIRAGEDLAVNFRKTFDVCRPGEGAGAVDSGGSTSLVGIEGRPALFQE